MGPFRTFACMLSLCAPLCGAALGVHAEERSLKFIEGEPEPQPPPPPPTVPDIPVPTPEMKAQNPAGVRVEVLPGPALKVGTKIELRVTAQKKGYLILVDVDASGKLTQIYPNILSLAQLPSGASIPNLVEPGRAVTIPDPGNPFAHFEFIAEPPLGTGTIVAILSDEPVQVIDLPNVPPALTGRQAAIDYLYGVASSLKIATADESGRFIASTWSFDAKTYEIK